MEKHVLTYTAMSQFVTGKARKAMEISGRLDRVPADESRRHLTASNHF